MQKTIKVPDRINYTKKARNLIEKIDESKFFCLNEGVLSRSELFAFAMAIGSDTTKTKLENIYPGGLVLDKSIDMKTKALIYALYINSICDKDLDSVTNKEAVYTMAQEYANTGFENLEDYFKTKKEDALMWELLKELDKQYEMLFDI